ncbi:TetR/AcrR family transcriptional regulator [Actinomadura rubrisoli]|uniref:TetR/AcrR family transcriptional regulator n=1 Tax=Actinomadura rubrisoli TaxID=2530368 RepID=A0A4R5ANC3_9ACTN|nr:TetR/AcrR family transcriptional regulator [Actinomadura rubrisoli]TDD74281.1 TetR/AcrR family transcriptional regulator [Actinomadura rubrisoli]
MRYITGTLPVVGQGPSERADAARSRRKILRATAELVAQRGAEKLSLDEVAQVAQVGVGTVYRRFGDRAGLLLALLDSSERRFQEAFIQGPPPLGPGAPPAERIRAFLHAIVDQVEEHPDLRLVTEGAAPEVRYGSGNHAIRRLHLVTLLSEIVPEADVRYLAEALLAPLTPSLIIYQRRHQGLSVDEIKSGLDGLLELIRARP